MHDHSSYDFSVTPPLYEKAKLAPGNNLTSKQTSEIVNAIVLSVDKFYKPRVVCRRRFTQYGVEKYYPGCIDISSKQRSFLHNSAKVKHSNQCSSKRPNYWWSISVYSENINDNLNTFEKSVSRESITRICQDFLISERYAHYIQNLSNVVKMPSDTNAKNIYSNNLEKLKVANVKYRSKISGARFGKSFRKSFPLMSTSGEWVSYNTCFLVYEFDYQYQKITSKSRVSTISVGYSGIMT